MVYKVNVVPIQIPVIFFIELEKKTLKLKWKPKRPKIAKAIWRDQIPDFKLYIKP